MPRGRLAQPSRSAAPDSAAALFSRTTETQRPALGTSPRPAFASPHEPELGGANLSLQLAVGSHQPGVLALRSRCLPVDPLHPRLHLPARLCGHFHLRPSS